MKRTPGSDLKNQSELIEELRKRQQFRFQLSVYLSWLGLLIICYLLLVVLKLSFWGFKLEPLSLIFNLFVDMLPL